MKKINVGYGKLGRSWGLDISDASTVGGDADVVRLLNRLAPGIDGTVTLVGKCSKHDPASLWYPLNVHNPWHKEWSSEKINIGNYKADGAIDAYIEAFMKNARKQKFDALVFWVGQHGGVSRRIPQIGQDWGEGELTIPLMQTAIYCSYLVELCNVTGIEPILLVPDPRNYLKLREFKKPFTRPILAQWDGTHNMKHEQFNDWPNPKKLKEYGEGRREQSVWVTKSQYVYSGIELSALDEPKKITCNMQHLHDFGIIVNENKKEVTNPRLPLLKEWVLEQWPQAIIHGTWSDESQIELGRKIVPVPVTEMYRTLRQFRATITFPASGSIWATAKPWECFAAGTVCFFHPMYDAQDNILLHERYNTSPQNRSELQELHSFLRVDTSDELRDRVLKLRKDSKLHERIVTLQRRHFERGFRVWNGGADMVISEIGERS